MSRRAAALAAGLAAGAVVGWYLAQRQLALHRHDLFARAPLRRLAALGYLAGDVSTETVRVLRDYVRWEPSPRLRARGQVVLRRLEAALAAQAAV